MRSRFPLYQSHIDVAHSLWLDLLTPGDVAVDATCGNGHDTLMLARTVLTKTAGKVFGFDIQPSAIEQTRALLESNLDADLLSAITLELRSHEHFPAELSTHCPKLFAYNLGYLPGGNKTITTRVQTTLSSLSEACTLLLEGGVISVTCYPGHEEGALEELAIKEWCARLPPLEWSCSSMQWTNRHNAPSLVIVQKKIGW